VSSSNDPCTSGLSADRSASTPAADLDANVTRVARERFAALLTATASCGVDVVRLVPSSATGDDLMYVRIASMKLRGIAASHGGRLANAETFREELLQLLEMKHLDTETMRNTVAVLRSVVDFNRAHFNTDAWRATLTQLLTVTADGETLGDLAVVFRSLAMVNPEVAAAPVRDAMLQSWELMGRVSDTAQRDVAAAMRSMATRHGRGLFCDKRGVLRMLRDNAAEEATAVDLAATLDGSVC
jgi:hypothetical protein